MMGRGNHDSPRGGIGKRHRELVAQLVHAGASTRGFRKAIERAFPSTVEDPIRWPRIVPDAYEIDVEAKRVRAYEVIISHGPKDRLDAYSDLWMQLDCDYICFELIVVLFDGSRDTVDLMRYWYDHPPTPWVTNRGDSTPAESHG